MTESLLGLLGGMLAFVGIGIRAMILYFHQETWSDLLWVFLHFIVFFFLLGVTFFATPHKLEEDPQYSGKWMLAGGILALPFSWFTAIAGTLLIAGGWQSLRKKEKPAKGKSV
ncbi:hypothetical protein CHM34_17470 [Paludifilum halophilum]|uniref:Uncharacterized protein n=2 Tax=Paludifilum halophilum TaxID=1642702 RepID=A0A235B1R7_9BACL|nr:hypothetical protein CHM34_17470 [Paludifilum halophilum]